MGEGRSGFGGWDKGLIKEKDGTVWRRDGWRVAARRVAGWRVRDSGGKTDFLFGCYYTSLIWSNLN